MPAATKPPVDEVGHVTTWAGFAGHAGWVGDGIEESPDLVFPQSVRTFERMRRTDAQVRGTWSAVTLPLRRDIYAVDPQDADPTKVNRIADDLDLPVVGMSERNPRQRRRGHFSWPEHNRLALLKLLHGFAPFEKVCVVENGHIRLRKLGYRPPFTIADIKVAPDGGLEWVEQWPLGSFNTGIGKKVVIPIDRLVWYVNEREGANWTGTSLLRSCYRDWLLKDRNMRVWSMSLERTGMPIPVAHGAEDTTADQAKELHAMAQAYRAGEGAGGYLPHGATLELVGAKGMLPDFRGSLEYKDIQIARSMLTQFLAMGTTQGGTGNRALGGVQMDFFVMALDAIASNIADTTQQFVLEWLWNLNYGEDEPCPRIVARSIDAERDVAPETVAELVKSGALEMDDELEDWMRSRNGMPTRSTPRVAADPATTDTDPPSPAAAEDAAVAAAHRGHRGTVLAAVEGENEIRSALGGLVDVAAILTAREAGESIADAVEAGLPGTGPLHSALLTLTTRAYSDGTAEATAKLPKSSFRSTPAPTRLIEIMDELGTRAAGMRDTLASRLRAVLAGGEAQGLTGSALTDLLEGVGDNIESARLIAVTETRRAVMAAAFDVYAANGITEFVWRRTSGSKLADICAENDGVVGPWTFADCPAHIRCSCFVEPSKV